MLFFFFPFFIMYRGCCFTISAYCCYDLIGVTLNSAVVAIVNPKITTISTSFAFAYFHSRPTALGVTSSADRSPAMIVDWVQFVLSTNYKRTRSNNVCINARVQSVASKSFSCYFTGLQQRKEMEKKKISVCRCIIKKTTNLRYFIA